MTSLVVILLMTILVTSFLVTRVVIGGVPALFTKAIASIGFLFSAILVLPYIEVTNFYLFLIVGLLFGLLGDILLDLKRLYINDRAVYLNYGMLVFGLGHLMYFMALGNQFSFSGSFVGKSFISLGIGLVASALIVFVLAKFLKLNFENFKWQSFAYSTVLISVAVLSLLISISTKSMWEMSTGLILFLASDLVLSTQYFGGKEDNNILTIINHVLYYAAQTLIVLQMY